MNEWRPYPAQQPEQGQLCLIATLRKGGATTKVVDRRAAEFWRPQPGFHDATEPGFADPDSQGCDYYPDPTHWQPFPDGPTEAS